MRPLKPSNHPNSKVNCFLYLVVCLIGMLVSNSVNAQSDVLIVIPDQLNPYQRMIATIKEQYKNKSRPETFDILNLDTSQVSSSTSENHARPAKPLKNYKLVITLGVDALEQVVLNKNIRSPILASFITETAFSTVSAKPGAQKILNQRFVGGISLEQPMYRIASLVKLIKPDGKSMGVVLGPKTRQKRAELHMQARRFGWKLNVADIQNDDNPVKILRPVFQRSQTMVVLPDKASFNRSIARWIIALSYRYQVPVISYSKKYADAGALVSVFSTPLDISRQTAEMAMFYLDNPVKKPRKLINPKYFDLQINQSVKRALGLKLDGKERLLAQLRRQAP